MVTALGCGDNNNPASADAAVPVDAPDVVPPVETFVNPPELTATIDPPDGTIGFNISVEPVEITLPDKDGNMNRHCLRQYADGSSAEPKTSMAGPTMRIPKGDGTARSVRMDLDNAFNSVNQMTLLDLYVDVNTTNFHVHGVHASPNDTAFSGDPTLYWADNVLMSNCPQECYGAMTPMICGTCSRHTPSAAGGPTDPWEYRFDIDFHQRHEPGTFWYHPHIHGTTALQLANGMAGALIVEDQLDDDICEAVRGAGDASCDNSAGGSKAFERILLLQTVRSQDPGLADGEECNEDTMTINDPNLDFFNADGLTPVFINGLYQPNLVMTANTPERWRFIQSSTSPAVHLAIGVPGSDGTCATLDDGRQIMYRMSADGLPFDRLYNIQELLLEPGYRYDVLLELPAEGSYCVWDVDEMDGQPYVEEVLATIDVVAGPDSSTLEGAYDAVNTLLNEYRCNSAAPQPDCSAPLDSPDHIVMFRQGYTPDDPGGSYCAETGLELNSLNGLRFNHHVLDRCLELDSTETWRVQAANGGHPFHIHINPFSVCKIVDDMDPAVAMDTGEICDCADTCGGACDCGECIYTTGECQLRPYLRDTLITRANEVSTIRHKFENYTGGFVQHCHILPHEDGGMMQHLEVKVGCQPEDERFCCANTDPVYQLCDDPAEQCLFGGTACASHNECCSGTCNGDSTCCRYGGDTCAQDSDCCSTVQTCADVDGAGTMECTRFAGAECTDNAECVSGICMGGTCQ